LEKLGIPREGGAIYELALTHRSFAFEQEVTADHNERLEFLGDAILEAVVTDLIYESYPDLSEGEMARLRASVVNTHALADIARELDIGDRLLLGKGEEASGGRHKGSILANALEALVGALFIDRGFEAARASLRPIFTDRLEVSMSAGQRYDAKTALQEIAVRDTGGSPSYRIASTGPDHDKRFTADVFVNDERIGSGSGRSKKEAEYNAAREALEHLQVTEDEAQLAQGGSRAGAG
jgi:ribonuclease-3